MASPRNILVLPFRRTPHLALSAAIRQYISQKFEQLPDMFAKDLETVDSLRKNAVTIQEPHQSGVQKIQAYAAQLVWMGGKFPLDIGADFAWYPSLGYDTGTAVSQNNIRFELANVLFNLAALYCQLAVASNPSTPEGLKSASNYFCLSAGVLSHLRSKVIPDMRSAPPEDMDPTTLECLEQLFLAQAQECFWQKAVKDGLKDASIAKLAAKVSDLYSQASDFGVRSETISSEWIHHMTAKHHHFAAAAQFRAACDCLEKSKYGEEVARLRDSVTCANEALKEARYINKAVLNDLHGLKNKVQEDLKRAEKDNDMIYLMPVPPKPELKILDRASMVSARIPKEVSEPLSFLGDNGELGTTLFAKLVPYSVHVAASIYASRRDQTVNSIIEELEKLTGRIHSLLQSLNLPGSLQALEKPLGLPPGLVSHAEEIRQQNGPDRIRRSMDDVAKLKANAKTTLQEGVNLLRSEAADDEQARRKYGTDRWSRAESQEVAGKLYGQVQDFEDYFQKAENGDETIREKFRKQEDLICRLNGRDRDLEDYVPSSRRATMTSKVEREVSRLRDALNEVSRMENRRKRKIESLRQKAQTDDVNPELLREAARLEREWPMQKIEAVQFEDFFDKRLQKYEPDQNIAQEEKDEQSTLLSRVAEANTAFTTARHGDSSTRERENALQQLENAYFVYKEIVQNLDVGRKFYNDLGGMVNKFRDECRTFAFQRRSEAAQLESDILTALPMSNLTLGAPTHQTPQPPPPHHPETDYQGRAPRSAEPMAAPVPIKPQAAGALSNNTDTAARKSGGLGPTNNMWTADKGIAFANVSTPHGPVSQQQQQQPQQPQQVQANGGPSQNNMTRTNRDKTWDPSQGLNFRR